MELEITVNVDIFACINFRGFEKIKILVFFIIIYPPNRIVNVIFTLYIFSQTFNKRELHKNMYYAHKQFRRIPFTSRTRL